jgi:hypothetical protein
VDREGDKDVRYYVFAPDDQEPGVWMVVAETVGEPMYPGDEVPGLPPVLASKAYLAEQLGVAHALIMTRGEAMARPETRNALETWETNDDSRYEAQATREKHREDTEDIRLMAQQGSELAQRLIVRGFPFADGRRFLHEDDVSHWILAQLDDGIWIEEPRSFDEG